jgi:hypothetical protein
MKAKPNKIHPRGIGIPLNHMIRSIQREAIPNLRKRRVIGVTPSS